MERLIRITMVMVLIFQFTVVKADKTKYHSLFIYNFSKYVKWPPSQSQDKFVIGVFGKSNITNILISTLKSKTVNGKPIEIMELGSSSDASSCNIVYIPQNQTDKLKEVAAQTAGKPVLIVSDNPGSTSQGSVINFVQNDGKIKFELNKSFAEERGLVVSSSLLSLSILV